MKLFHLYGMVKSIVLNNFMKNKAILIQKIAYFSQLMNHVVCAHLLLPGLDLMKFIICLDTNQLEKISIFLMTKK